MDHILIIDNSPITNVLMSIILKNHRFSIINARNGFEGMIKVNQIISKGDKISVCIIDISLPIMDGMDFLREFRKIENTTPIIVLSSEFEKDKIEECIKLGASWWVEKPFNPGILVSTIKNIMTPNNIKEGVFGEISIMKKHVEINQMIHQNMWRLQ